MLVCDGCHAIMAIQLQEINKPKGTGKGDEVPWMDRMMTAYDMLLTTRWNKFHTRARCLFVSSVSWMPMGGNKTGAGMTSSDDVA